MNGARVGGLVAALPGALVGLLVALAVLLVIAALRRPRPPRDEVRGSSRPLARLLLQAGWSSVSPSMLIAGSVLAGLVGGVLTAAVTGLPVAALLAAIVLGSAPLVLLRRRARQRTELARASWPEAVDTMVAGIRAGLGLPDAVSAVAVSGPAVLRPVFAAASGEHRATGSFDAALDRLQDTAADAVADRVVVALRLARELGGTSVGEVLRTLSTMLREDARIRAEIRGRQSWTVSAARMAVAAPWITLLLLSTRPETVAAFASPGGTVVLALAALLTVGAYLLMTRLARLPELPRLAS